MKKPDHDFYTLKELTGRWQDYKITETDLLQYGIDSKLQICVKPLLPEGYGAARYIAFTKILGSCRVSGSF